MFLQALANPMELFALAMFALNDKKVVIDKNKPPGYLLCYELLNKTSRSFARVIQALEEELKHPIAIFYLVLRALDTIEDDMTLPLERKLELLKSFHELTQQKGWNFQESGPDEKDAILLREYNVVIDELLQLKPVYQNHIISITKRMGLGMAEFVQGKEVITMDDYNLYTHYVAGLVGLGLTGLFVSSGMESEKLLEETKLSNEMGLFLQKVNILKDFTADSEEGRLYWPRDVWSLYVSPGAELTKIENKQNALACLNHLCADALELVPSCLEYLSMLKTPSVFEFAAIPQVMAMATFALFYNNYCVFEGKGSKIRRGLAVKLMQRATDINSVKKIYLEYATEISKKSRQILGTNPKDESFKKISLACANIVKWIKIHDEKHKKITTVSQSPINMWYVVLVMTALVFISNIPMVQ